ncbi:MAG: hypothetical protein Kow0068_21570 [Marinilabiliales bacterium]
MYPNFKDLSTEKNIKSKIAYAILNNKIKKITRQKGTFNLENAKSIGILFNARNIAYYNSAREFFNYLKNKRIDIWSLGYTEDPDVIEAYSYQIGMNHFTKKSLNWYKKPKGNNIDQFINKELDILIDLSLIDFFPIHYIVGLSKAKMKVGIYQEHSKYYDLMIDIGDNKNLDFYIEQLKHYLSIIKP